MDFLPEGIREIIIRLLASLVAILLAIIFAAEAHRRSTVREIQAREHAELARKYYELRKTPGDHDAELRRVCEELNRLESLWKGRKVRIWRVGDVQEDEEEDDDFVDDSSDYDEGPYFGVKFKMSL